MQLGGLVVALFAWFWLLVCAFRQERWRWGLGQSLGFASRGITFCGEASSGKGAAPLLLMRVESSLRRHRSGRDYILCVRARPRNAGEKCRLMDTGISR